MSYKMCGDCARFTSINETDGECSRHGATTCYIIRTCKDFIPNKQDIAYVGYDEGKEDEGK